MDKKNVKLFWVADSGDLEKVNEWIGDRKAEVAIHPQRTEAVVYIVTLI